MGEGDWKHYDNQFAFASLDKRRFAVRSTNALLGQFPGAIGLKTGFTPGAGRCLVALAELAELDATQLHTAPHVDPAPPHGSCYYWNKGGNRLDPRR